METESKGAMKSKINWLGLGLAVVPMIEPARDFVVNLVPDPWKPAAVSLFGFGLIVLRTFFTKQPVQVNIPFRS